jgi:3-hydroxyisobutyrate dehydrogenase-like beta-hydroxyacid dehydrogenase
MKVGFIGIGSMGLPMAQRIQSQGHDLVLYARRAASLEPFEGTAATVVATPAEMGAVVDSVGICVFDAAGVDEVVFGEEGLAETMKPGTVIMMHSTVASDEIQALAAKAEALGFRMLDAPVSGGQPQAEIGKLTVMVGGDPAALADVADVLATFSDHVVHLGGIGAGSRAKLVNNTMLAAQIALADDAMAAGAALGLDAQGLADVLLKSSSAGTASQIRMRLGSLADVLGSSIDLTLSKDVKLMSGVLGDAPGKELVEGGQRFVGKLAAARAAAG